MYRSTPVSPQQAGSQRQRSDASHGAAHAAEKHAGVAAAWFGPAKWLTATGCAAAKCRRAAPEWHATGSTAVR